MMLTQIWWGTDKKNFSDSSTSDVHWLSEQAKCTTVKGNLWQLKIHSWQKQQKKADDYTVMHEFIQLGWIEVRYE